MWAMVVVVDVPHCDGLGGFGFAAELGGVEDFLGEDPLVALHFPIVPRGVGPGPLVTGQCADGSGEVGGPVAGAVEFLRDVKAAPGRLTCVLDGPVDGALCDSLFRRSVPLVVVRARRISSGIW